LYLKGEREKSFSITLKHADINHLRKFRKVIGSNGKIGYIQSNKSVHLGFYSCDKIFDSLVKRGVTPNKSLRIKKVIVHSRLMSHFIRGVFDGDGSLSGNKITHIQFQIAGYKPLLRQIQGILVKKCHINKVKIYSLSGQNKASRVQYTGSQIFKILDFLYKNSTSQTRLERKYKKYLLFKKKFRK